MIPCESLFLLVLILAEPVIQGKNKKPRVLPKSLKDESAVVGHIPLTNGPVRRLFTTQHFSSYYLYAEFDAGKSVALIDVTKATRPLVLADVTYPSTGGSNSLLAVAGTAALVTSEPGIKGISKIPQTIRVIDLFDPQHPKIAHEFTGVTAICRDNRRGLIFVANCFGVWILQQHLAADPEVQNAFAHHVIYDHWAVFVSIRVNAQAESSSDIQTYHIESDHRAPIGVATGAAEHWKKADMARNIHGKLYLAVHHRGRNAYGLGYYVKVTASSACVVLMVGYLSGVFVSREQVYTYDRENVLGTSFEFKAIAVSDKEADQAMTAALAEIDREAKILSSYDPSSEFSGWFRTVDQPVQVSRDFYEVLSLWDQWRRRTDAALDAAAAAVIQVWKTAAAENREPSRSELSIAVADVQKIHWSLNPVTRTATHMDHVPLVLDSFTKSYIIGHAADAALAASQVRGVVVNIGGDLVVRGQWTEPIEVADPFSLAENADPISRVRIRNRAVATSGSYRRGVEIGGRHYSHIVDPRTGRSAEDILSSTVVAPSPVVAGALATAFSVMNPEESERLAAEFPDVEYLIVESNGKRVASPGWQGLESPRVPFNSRGRVPVVYAADQTWNPAFELNITLQIARIDEFRVRPPYVAVWIEDAKRYPVRMIALWYRKPRYLDDMRAWYRQERTRSSAEGTELPASVTGATRSAGTYTLKWDGKDNLGRYVPAGKYSVLIEAAREHGTYQLIRRELDFNGTPQQVHLPGNAEISSAALDYHQISSH